MSEILVIALGAILINNFVLSQFLGICPFLGVSRKMNTALGMGMAVTFVMTLASVMTFIAQRYILDNLPQGIGATMQTAAFILIIAALVQFVEMFLQKSMPGLYGALGIYLPLITTNCAVLGVTLLNMQKDYDFLYSVVYGAAAGLGFTLAIVLLAGVRERLEISNIPKALQGFPITLIAVALMAMAFWGFQGLTF